MSAELLKYTQDVLKRVYIEWVDGTEALLCGPLRLEVLDALSGVIPKKGPVADAPALEHTQEQYSLF